MVINKINCVCMQKYISTLLEENLEGVVPRLSLNNWTGVGVSLQLSFTFLCAWNSSMLNMYCFCISFKKQQF